MANMVPYRDDAESKLIIAESELDTVRKENEKLVKQLAKKEYLEKLKPHATYLGFALSITAISGIGAAVGGVSIGFAMGLAFSITYGVYFFFAIWNWLYQNWDRLWRN